MKTCELCGKEFAPHKFNPKQRFCSRQCSHAWHGQQRRHEFICQGCGELFKAKKLDRNRFCSRECHWEYRRANPANPPKSPSLICCRACGREFEQKYDSLLCSEECRKADARTKERERKASQIIFKPRLCKECKQEFTPEYGTKRRVFCSALCARRAKQKLKNDGNHNGRARKVLQANFGHSWRNYYEPIDALKIFNRDGWRCHLCKRKTPKKLRGTIEDRAPELDHIVPLSRGGSHMVDNVACACRKCNIAKSDRIIGQLRLIG